MRWTSIARRGALLAAVMTGLVAGVGGVSAQSSPPAVVQPAPPPPAPPGPPAAVNPPAIDAAPLDKTVPDTSISQLIDVQARPALQLGGKATWDEGFKSLNDAFTRLNEALAKANVHSAGNPIAVFTTTDDAGFTFSAMVPVDKAPDAKPADMAADLSFGTTPAGRVMKFQHRSAYDDIDSTYEAITAYLDEKGIEAKNMFAEEYLNRTKTSDDPSLEVDIYVYLK